MASAYFTWSISFKNIYITLTFILDPIFSFRLCFSFIFQLRKFFHTLLTNYTFNSDWVYNSNLSILIFYFFHARTTAPFAHYIIDFSSFPLTVIIIHYRYYLNIIFNKFFNQDIALVWFSFSTKFFYLNILFSTFIEIILILFLLYSWIAISY